MPAPPGFTESEHQKGTPMTEYQKYLLDLQGFITVEEVLTDDECDMAIEKI